MQTTLFYSNVKLHFLRVREVSDPVNYDKVSVCSTVSFLGVTQMLEIGISFCFLVGASLTSTLDLLK